MMVSLSVVSLAQTDESTLFPESIDPGDFRPSSVLLPPSPLSMQVLFVGGYDSVETRKGRALAKQWHDFIGFTPSQSGEGDLGWVSVNHERIVADDKIGDGGGMTTFKVKRVSDDSIAIVHQTLPDGRSGKFFNVNFDNVGETGMNCAGITSLYDGRIWTAEEWFRSSVSSIYQGGNGVRDTSDFTISGSGFPGFDGQTIKKVDNFNYMVEIDPRQSEAIRKQYNWGRGGWEGGVVMPDNKTVYLGEDARPGLFTRFIADTPGDFTQGTYSYYAYDEVNEKAYWKDYPINNITDAANLSASNGYADGARTFRGAPFVGDSAAAMFIRNEWVAAHNGRVYWSETGNQGFWNEFTDYRLHKSSPTAIADYNGMGYNGKIGNWHLEAARMRFPDLNAVSNDSVREWLTAAQNFTDAHGRVLCYDPITEQTHVFLEGGPYPGDANSASASLADGYPEKHLSNPDGLNFITTPQGKTFMLILEDLNQSSYNSVPADAQGNRMCEIYALDMDIQNPTIDDLIRISAVPVGAEITGAQQTSDGKTLLVNSQHPSSANPFPFNNSLTYAIHGWDKLAELAERRVAKLAMYDAKADTFMQYVAYGDKVYVDDLEDRKLAFKVVMEPEKIDGSVAMDLQGPISLYRVENVAPYSLFGKSKGVLTGKKMKEGMYELEVTPNDKKKRQGNDGISRTFKFEMINATSVIEKFLLLDGYTQAVIAEITQGATIEVPNLSSTKLNIEAVAKAGSSVESIWLKTSGKGSRKDSEAPYTQFSKRKKFGPGKYTTTAFPYDQDVAQGNQLATTTIDFYLVDPNATSRTTAPEVETGSESTFVVYPNPVAASLNFSKESSVAIYNEMGQRIAVYQNVKTINVKDFRYKLGTHKTFFVLAEGEQRAVRVVLKQ